MIDYRNEVTKYGASLSEKEKNVAREVFNDLLAQGFEYDWLYFAIERLNGRSILECPKLLFYKAF